MRKVLIIRGSAIGDIVECLPVASALKNNFDEEFEIHWMVKRKFKKILEGNRFIKKILCFEDYKDLQFRIIKRIYRRRKNLDGLNSWLRFSSANKLKKEHYDIVINLHGKLDARMFNVMCEAPKSITAPYLDNHSTIYDHMVLKTLESLKLLDSSFDIDAFSKQNIDYGWGFSIEESSRINNVLIENGCSDNNYIVLVLSTTWEAKNYPVENWIELTELLLQIGYKIVFVGDSKDKDILNRIKQSVKSDLLVDLIGITSLREMVIVLSKADVVVGGDTGPLHIAASFDLKTVTLMNPTNPKSCAPFNNKGVVLMADYPCNCCWKVKCPKGICCMKYIAPIKVYQNIKDILNN